MAGEVSALTQEVKPLTESPTPTIAVPEAKKESVIGIIGERIDTEAMNYAPTNEMGVIFLAGFLWDRLGISHIEEMHGNGFPDAIAVKKTGKDNGTYKRVRIEFEYIASNFKLHNHPIDQCDIIICWENDWFGCPIEVIELKNYIKSVRLVSFEKNECKIKLGDAMLDLVREFPKEWDSIVKQEMETYKLWRNK